MSCNVIITDWGLRIIAGLTGDIDKNLRGRVKNIYEE